MLLLLLIMYIKNMFYIRLDANRDASRRDPVRRSVYNIIIRLGRDGQFNARYLRSLIASPPPPVHWVRVCARIEWLIIVIYGPDGERCCGRRSEK